MDMMEPPIPPYPVPGEQMAMDEANSPPDPEPEPEKFYWDDFYEDMEALCATTCK